MFSWLKLVIQVFKSTYGTKLFVAMQSIDSSPKYVMLFLFHLTNK